MFLPENKGFAPPAKLFLPLAEGSADALCRDLDTTQFFASASNAELACVLLIQNLPNLAKQKATLTKIEVIFDGVLRAALTPIPLGQPSFSRQVQARFDSKLFAAGVPELQMLGISLVDASTVAGGDYLTSDGAWDFTFSPRHLKRVRPEGHEILLPSGSRMKLHDQQSRVFNEFKSGLDESFHLQGYAGFGKTFLISKFFELLNPATTMLVAYLPAQLGALKRRIQLPSGDTKLNAYTFGHLANLILNRDYTSRAWRLNDVGRTDPSYMVTDQQMGKWLNLQPVSTLTPREVANLCRRTVFSFCVSGSKGFEAKHIPATGSKLSDVDVAVLLEYSRLMWSETISPTTPEIRFPVRNVHRIKYLALGSGTIPDQYTHIIVDESHELTPPMLQILDRSPQAVLTLGDDFQHLHGMAARHSDLVRQRNVTQSLRSGKQMGEVLNPFIQLHPGSIKDEFEGRASHPTVVTQYDDVAPIPDRETTVIVANEWGLAMWFKKLVDADANFEIRYATLKEFRSFFAGLATLHGSGGRANHRMLFRYATWNDLASTMGGNYGFLAAQEMLDRGFSVEMFDAYMATHCENYAEVTLARVDDVKNQEFDRVLISRDLMRPPQTGVAHSLASVCSMLYTAASRARHELLVPGDLPDWTSDISRQNR